MGEGLAPRGGEPVRHEMLPYGRQLIDEADIAAVVEVLRGDWLTTGPMVEAFETAFANYVGADHAVVVNSGTAALHASIFAAGIGPGDEVIVPALTFAASANCVLYLGGRPVFVDVEADTLLIDATKVESLITARTKAIVAVDYAGQPCDYQALQDIAIRHDLTLVSDACHALGASYRGQAVGTLADLNCFSFHPVKHITTAEGGMIATQDEDLARRMRWFRNHGITTDHRQRAKEGAFAYDMVALGYNYRLADLNCALGLSQLAKLNGWVARRREIAEQYDRAFSTIPQVRTPARRMGRASSWHIYPVLLDLAAIGRSREDVFAALRAENIGVNVHYRPVYLHSYYAGLGYQPGLCPIAEDAYARLITLPIHPGMSDGDVYDVVEAVKKVLSHVSVFRLRADG